jgi:hypothetical protein
MQTLTPDYNKLIDKTMVPIADAAIKRKPTKSDTPSKPASTEPPIKGRLLKAPPCVWNEEHTRKLFLAVPKNKLKI